MSQIADFLRARYAEDAAAVRANWNRDGIASERYHGTPIDPTRLLDDLDAKIGILDWHDVASSSPELDRDAWHIMRQVLLLLAVPFAGHPDHKGEEWAP